MKFSTMKAGVILCLFAFLAENAMGEGVERKCCAIDIEVDLSNRSVRHNGFYLKNIL